MQIKQLKLVGFKSFVDPAVIHFKNQLVAVVGPNGCGKSNIVDAVRWVMGESAIRNLRGEIMTDVIFNGSTSRKSVGQASVELTFDNSLGSLAGPWGNYAEIVIKRTVTRSGDATYYLNGSPCRRKDITDIFLGTGAGARSYSIIGQGTISRLIEAKPEELRVFIEEAAGISKYKERRRETLQRIARARDNLSRIIDIREELDNQLRRLERQAKSAERYLLLKEEEKLCRAEIAALKWQTLITQQKEKQQCLNKLALESEGQVTLIAQTTNKKTDLNEQVHEVQEQVNFVQAKYYQLGTEIARFEEIQQQQLREQKRLACDKQQLESDWQMAWEQLQRDKMLLEEKKVALQDHVLNALQVKEGTEKLEREHRILEQQYRDWEDQWQVNNNRWNELTNELHLCQLTYNDVEQKHHDALSELDQLMGGPNIPTLDDLEQTSCQLKEKNLALEAQRQLDEEKFHQLNSTANSLRNQLQAIEQTLYRAQASLHQIQAQYLSLTTIQQALHRENIESEHRAEFWSDKSRLMEVLQIEPDWRFACEQLFGSMIHAYVVHDLAEVWQEWSELYHGVSGIVTLKLTDNNVAAYPRLVDKFQNKIPTTMLYLEHIFAAESLSQAREWLPHLKEQESILTQDGIWLGNGWLKVMRPLKENETNILDRQSQINQLKKEISLAEHQVKDWQQQRDKLYGLLQDTESKSQLARVAFEQSKMAASEHQLALIHHQQVCVEVDRSRKAVQSQQEKWQQLLQKTSQDLSSLTVSIAQLKQQKESMEQDRVHWQKAKEDWHHTLHNLNEQRLEQRSLHHQLELVQAREKTTIEQLSEQISREEVRIKVLDQRINQLNTASLQATIPENTLQEQLDTHRLLHGEIESQLNDTRERLLQLKDKEAEFINQLSQYELGSKKIQAQLETIKLEEQALALRAASILESLVEEEYQPSVLLENMSAQITQSQREDHLIGLHDKIKHLGAINLAAVEEYAVEKERKSSLDEQYDDLNHALTQLETAIVKIDKETEQRFANTFNEINISFQHLFPRLFGAGKAQLELTCDNLLEAGIVVMAQPPGKRNSTIHLLSGGEKAMTAVALVFAIFQLNPSPFCMLDEVDAPLDEVNVGRFCALVKEMSQSVQFLFITHNKVTMELADQLIGVTMREPGVSRLVTVDVKTLTTME